MKKPRFVDVTISFEEFTNEVGKIFKGDMREYYENALKCMGDNHTEATVETAYKFAVYLTTISATFDRELEDFTDVKLSNIEGLSNMDMDVEEFITEYGYELLLGEVGDYE